MDTRKKLLSLIAAGALAMLAVGTTLATGASDQGVVPTEVDGNITLAGGGNNDKADCDAADGIETGNTGGSDTTDNGVTVTWTYDGTTKEFGFTATGGLVTIAYVKGSDSYNVYDYTGFAGGGVASDGGMFAPDNESGPAGLSHAVFCTTPVEATEPPVTEPPVTEPPVTAPPSFEQSQAADTDAPTEPNTATLGGNGTSAPADGAWLLVVALGVLLSSIVVLTPARARTRR